jgi:hypothetical protein
MRAPSSTQSPPPPPHPPPPHDEPHDDPLLHEDELHDDELLQELESELPPSNPLSLPPHPSPLSNDDASPVKSVDEPLSAYGTLDATVSPSSLTPTASRPAQSLPMLAVSAPVPTTPPM